MAYLEKHLSTLQHTVSYGTIISCATLLTLCLKYILILTGCPKTFLTLKLYIETVDTLMTEMLVFLDSEIFKIHLVPYLFVSGAYRVSQKKGPALINNRTKAFCSIFKISFVLDRSDLNFMAYSAVCGHSPIQRQNTNSKKLTIEKLSKSGLGRCTKFGQVSSNDT